MPGLVEGKTGTLPDGTRVVVRGGQIVPLSEKPQGGLKAAPAEWGAGAIELPNGDILGPQGPRGGARQKIGTLPGAAGAGPGELKEFQVNAAARATLMDAGQNGYMKARAEGYNPASLRNNIASGVEGVPLAGGFMADLIRDGVSERGRSAELQFTDGALRTTSGANAPEPEVRRASRQYFRQAGESNAAEPEREALRRRFRDQAVVTAGPAYIDPKAPGNDPSNPLNLAGGQSRAGLRRGVYYRDPQGNIRRNDNGDTGNPIITRAQRNEQLKQTSAVTRQGGPAVGTVKQGYRFKGGDPGNPSSWAKVQ